VSGPGEGRLSPAATFRSSWSVFTRQARQLLILAAVIELPLALMEVVLHVTPGLRGLTEQDAFGPAVAIVVIYGALSHHFFAGLLERVVSAERDGHRHPTLGEVVRNLPWHRLIVADLILTTLLAIGLSLFVIPGLVVATWFAVTLPIINLEDRRVLDAFGRSVQLVRGRAWSVAVIAIGSFAVPQAIVAVLTLLAHTGNATVDVLIHAGVATLVLPLAALPLVVATFELVALDERRRAQPAPGS